MSAEHEVQVTSYAWSHTDRSAGLTSSVGFVGDALGWLGKAIVKSSMHHDLLDCKRWIRRIELSHAIFYYVKWFSNRHRRHSHLGHDSMIESERTLFQEAT